MASDCNRTCFFPFNFKHRKKVERRDHLLQDQQKFISHAFKEGPIDPSVEFIQLEEDYELKIFGYRRNGFYTAIYWMLIVFSFGIFGLFCYWFNRLRLYTTHTRCPLIYATTVLIEEKYKDQHKSYHVKKINILTYESVFENSECAELSGWDSRTAAESDSADDMKFSVHTSGGIFKKMEKVRCFNCRKSRFIWDSELGQFYKLNGLDQNVATSYFHQQSGLSSLEQYLRRAVYGTNEIRIPQRSLITLLFFEILNPFYVFQFFSFVIWCLDEYVLYASAIMIMTVISIVGSGLSTYFNQRELHKRVCSSDIVHIIQGDEQVSIPTEHLVPGDILVLPTQGCVMYCDAVLLNGSCIANESALTGESDPVMKTPIPNARHAYENKEHARHTLYCGTEILQTRFYGNKHVLAIVIRTGFSTTKGAVMRTLLYPAPADYKFEKHSYKFVEFLAAIAGIGFLYTIVSKSLRGLPPFVIAMEALDLITVVVPPALPAAMTIGAVHALLRLKKRSIFCISPRSINVSGSVNCICFDKTGTLTEEGLNMWGVIPTCNTTFSDPIRDLATLPPSSDLLYAMVTCHTLTIIREKLCGDPMDLKIFESTGWQLEEPAANDDTKYDLIIPTIVKPAPTISTSVAVEFVNSSLQLGKEIGIVRHFTFSSSLQRMTVITRVLGASNYNIYCKGAPESICNLCVPETVPQDFHVVLKNYTRKGYRVIATAFRPLPSSINYTKMQRLAREEVENDLVFLGLIVLENKLKPETTPVISKLKAANLRLVIVTGDNLLTAVSVARDCGIILPEQDVIAIQCVEAPVPHVYYTYADVSPITSSISSPAFNHKRGSDGASTDETHLTELSPSTNTVKDVGAAIPFDCAANVVCTPPKNYVFALTGANWMFLKQHFPELIPYIGIKANIFSRMNPDQKQNLVREMQSLGYVVAMCGDGANDCGALKAAHTGISLSNNESSAASPFTSKVQDIRCILDIIKEGRAALVTSFALFKFMALYSLTQFVSLMILYSIDSNLTDMEFLYIDLFIIACCAFSLGHTPPYEGKLASKPPPSSLISLAALTSLLLQTSVMIAVQLISFFAVQQYHWFTPYNSTGGGGGGDGDGDDKSSSESSYENYAVFSISALQYVILTIAFHKGPPYVGYICSNYILIVCLISITSSTLYVVLVPAENIQQLFKLQLPPQLHFRFVVVALALVNLTLSLLVEIVVCDYLLSTVLKQRLHASSKWRKLYANVEHELVSRSDWPTVSCDGDFENTNTADGCAATATAATTTTTTATATAAAADSCMKNGLLFRGSQTIPRKLSPAKHRSISSSVPNINETAINVNLDDADDDDVKLTCVSSQTTVQSDYFTPNENFSFIFTS